MSNLDNQKEFTIFLPSDASYDLYKNNTLSQYTVDLPETVKLNDDYEVALAEIIYPTNILNVPNNLKVYLKYKTPKGVLKTILELEFNKGLYNEEVELFNSLKSLLQSVIIEKINDGIKKDFPKSINENLKLPEITYENNYITIHNGEIYITKKDKLEIYWDFDEYLHNMLGFGSDQTDEKKSKAKFGIDIFGHIHTMFVYTNIVQPSIVGHKKANILRIISLDSPKNTKISEMKRLDFNPAIYFPLKQLNFDTIEIQLRDNSGRFIEFMNGKVIITLTFRPTKQNTIK